MKDILGRRLAALADPTRRAIVSRLAFGEATVSDLSKPFDISQPAISKHLKVLEAAGLVVRGQLVHGQVAQSRPRRLNVEALRETAAWIDQVSTLWHDSFDRLDAILRSGAVEPNAEPSGIKSSEGE